jgi:predicted unusual protein kinase regulating ubiquinone biosynthesis (AarF/ABC1/UbiB family)
MQIEAEGSLIGRAARVASVMAKYGLRETRGSGEALEVRAARLRDALEELGPTYAKLGQILSTRPDLLPPEFISQLATLQDDVAPLTEAEVVQVMEEELGVPWEDVFASIDPEPLAAGTIGQVHRATLEAGDRVVVKVQRPGARDEIMRDVELLRLFAQKTENREALRRIVDLPAVVEHLAGSLQRELDFEQEAANIDRMREVL